MIPIANSMNLASIHRGHAPDDFPHDPDDFPQSQTLQPAAHSVQTPPMYATSLASSPPNGTLPIEQREVRRQQELNRRRSKSRLRRERSVSNPHYLPGSVNPSRTFASGGPFTSLALPEPSTVAVPVSGPPSGASYEAQVLDTESVTQKYRSAQS